MLKYALLMAISLGAAPAFAEISSPGDNTSSCCDCPTKTCGCYNQITCAYNAESSMRALATGDQYNTPNSTEQGSGGPAAVGNN